MNKQFYLSVTLFFGVLVLGSLGYHYGFGFSWIEGLYMTVITITTVGFSEIAPLDDAGRVFTIGLIFTSIVIYGYLVKVISSYLSDNFLLHTLKTNRMLKRISKLKNHTIVCGYGRNGKQALLKLQNYGKKCVVIEKKPEIVKQIIEQNIPYVEGNAVEDLTLKNAGITNAENIITAFGSDSDNLYVVLSARQLNPKINIVSRAASDSSCKKMKIAGADKVIMPDLIGGEHMANVLVTPDLIEFVKKISSGTKDTPNLVEIPSEKFPTKFLNRPIRDLDLRRKTGCNIIGFVSNTNEYVINPSSDVILTEKSNLIILATHVQIAQIKKYF